MRYVRWNLLVILILAFLLTSACSSAPSPTPVVQTVIQTVPVEVTRNVEVTRIVEITRDVVVTQMIDVPVTVTPSLPEATPTLPVMSQPTAMLINSTPQVTPQEKYTGFTPIFVQNQTGNKIDITITGPSEFNLSLWGGVEQKIWVKEGDYTYTVGINGQEVYHGKFKIVSADKYILLLYENKAILRIP